MSNVIDFDAAKKRITLKHTLSETFNVLGAACVPLGAALFLMDRFNLNAGAAPEDSKPLIALAVGMMGVGYLLQKYFPALLTKADPRPDPPPHNPDDGERRLVAA